MTIQHNESSILRDNLDPRNSKRRKCSVCSRGVFLLWTIRVSGVYVNGGAASEHVESKDMCWKCRLTALKLGHEEERTENSHGRLLVFRLPSAS